MNIQGYNSEYALVAIKNQIDKYNALEQSDFEINSELLYDDNHINEDKPIISEKDISAIFLWRTSHLSVSSIAFKVGI